MPPDLSLEQICAALPEDQQEEVLAGLDLDELPWDWHWTGRPSQILPVLPEDGGNDWDLALLLGGRGAGKSRAGSEWIKELDQQWHRLGRAQPGTRLRIALLGRTAADVRDTLVQGESGLLSVYPPSLQDLVVYTPSNRRVDLPSGAMVLCASADEPDQLRGPQFYAGLADELAAHKQVKGSNNLTAWENMKFAIRLGSRPQLLATTTPRRVTSVRKIVKDAETNPRILLRRSATSANVHLDLGWYQTLVDTYGGTEKGRQELEGELIDSVSGAVTSQDRLNVTRVDNLPPTGEFYRYVGLDPSTSEAHRDEAGIVVVYVSKVLPVSSRHAYIIEDLTDQYSPDQWSQVAVAAATRHRATIVVETNAGGALIKNSLQQVATAARITCPPIRETWSSKAKAVRAEPVGVAIARGRVHMVGHHELLEDELVSWVSSDRWSPNRLDAMVFGVVAGLFDSSLTQSAPGGATVHSVTGRRADPPRQVTVKRDRQQMRIAARRSY